MLTARCTTFDVTSPKTASRKPEIEDISSLEILRLWEEHQLSCIEKLDASLGKPAFLFISISTSVSFTNLEYFSHHLQESIKMSSNSPALSFGIEMEFLLKPKAAMREPLKNHKFNDKVTTDSKDEKAKDANRDALRNALVDILATRDIEAGTSIGNYDRWIVADESVLDERTGYCKSTTRLRPM